MKNIKIVLLIFTIIFISFGNIYASEGEEFVDEIFSDAFGIDTTGTDTTGISENENFPGNNYDEFGTYESRKLMSGEVNINIEENINTEENTIKVTKLPTTGPETVLLLIISFLIASFILFKNKNQSI